MRYLIWLGIVLGLLMPATTAQAQYELPTPVCPDVGIQPRPQEFEPAGIILSTWDFTALWVYDIARNARYPLPNTAPCGTNCHLSDDAQWITYHNIERRAFGRMRLDGTQRSILASYAAEVDWWSDDRLLVWSGSNNAYLFSLVDGSIEWLDFPGLVNVQPGGYWGVAITAGDGEFERYLVDARNFHGFDNAIYLGIATRYFEATSWSPNGEWLAVIGRGAFHLQSQTRGAELFAVRPEDGTLIQWTNFSQQVGAVRINGHAPGSISWSPDGNHIAFWVMPMTSDDPATAGPARIHILNVQDGSMRVYCDYETTEHTPNPPRLVWSPDGTHIAFGGENIITGSSTLLLALNVETGVFTALSGDVYPALGSPDVVAWGNK
jgi:WD40 repeat protein